MNGGWRGGEPVCWPDTFGTRFTVFVDTEEEFDWSAPLSSDNRAVTHIGSLPDADRRLRGLGALPAYLVDHPVATNPAAADVLKVLASQPHGEIGAQLHPWVNPPIAEPAAAGGGFVGNLPRAAEAAKLRVLTDAVAAAVGRSPRVFRAGRYGIGPATAELLAVCGYRLDSSMRARFDYRAEGGPGFAQVGNDAFRLGPCGALLELPLTTVFTGRLARHGGALFPQLRSDVARGVAARLGLLARVPLTPEGVPVAQALEAVRIALGEGARVLNFAFHSPSLVPGHTPYVRDARALVDFYRWWDQVLALLAARGVAAVSVGELLDAAASLPPASPIR